MRMMVDGMMNSWLGVNVDDSQTRKNICLRVLEAWTVGLGTVHILTGTVPVLVPEIRYWYPTVPFFGTLLSV